MPPEKVARPGSAPSAGKKPSPSGAKGRVPPNGVVVQKDVTPRKVPGSVATPQVPTSARDGKPLKKQASQGGEFTSMRPDSAAGAGTPGYIKQSAQATTLQTSGLPEVHSARQPSSKRENASKPGDPPPSDRKNAAGSSKEDSKEDSKESHGKGSDSSGHGKGSVLNNGHKAHGSTDHQKEGHKKGDSSARGKSSKSPRSSSPRSTKSGGGSQSVGLLGWFSGLGARKSGSGPGETEVEEAAAADGGPTGGDVDGGGGDSNPLKLGVQSTGNRKSRMSAIGSPRPGSERDLTAEKGSMRTLSRGEGGETEEEERMRIWTTVSAAPALDHFAALSQAHATHCHTATHKEARTNAHVAMHTW